MIKKNKLLKENEDNLTQVKILRSGLTAVISVKHPNLSLKDKNRPRPNWEIAKLLKLANRLFSEVALRFSFRKSQLLRRLSKRNLASKARIKALREVTRKKSWSRGPSNLPGKLAIVVK